MIRVDVDFGYSDTVQEVLRLIRIMRIRDRLLLAA
jgi:hypothetical protein